MTEAKRGLVFTSLEPFRKGSEIWGTYWRFRLLLEAMCKVAQNVDIVHLVSPEFVREAPSAEILSVEQSAFLGLPVAAHLISCQHPRQQTFVNHYLSGILSVQKQNEFFWYAGPDQVAKVCEFLDHSPDVV